MSSVQTFPPYKKVVVRAQHPWESGCQKLSPTTYQNIAVLKQHVSFCCFGIIFFPLKMQEYKKIASVKVSFFSEYNINYIALV